jgi:hypothetical protein
MDDLDDLRHEVLVGKRRNKGWLYHPHPSDPDCPEWEVCSECELAESECKCEEN